MYEQFEICPRSSILGLGSKVKLLGYSMTQVISLCILQAKYLFIPYNKPSLFCSLAWNDQNQNKNFKP